MMTFMQNTSKIYNKLSLLLSELNVSCSEPVQFIDLILYSDIVIETFFFWLF